MGLDLEKFLGEFQHCFATVLASKEEFPEIEVDPELIPEIHLAPTRITLCGGHLHSMLYSEVRSLDHLAPCPVQLAGQ